MWQALALAVGLDLLLPGPWTVAVRLWELGGTAAFWRSAGLTLLRVFGGFAGGAALAVALAAAVSAWSWADWVLSPAVRVVRATPVPSFILLIVLWADKGVVPAIVAGLMALPVVWENTVRGVGETDPKLLELGRAYRLGPWRTLGLIYAPSALPYVASGCRTALGLAWKAGVAAEVLCLPRWAMGTQIAQSKLYTETPSLFAWTVVVILCSILLERALGFAFGRKRGRGRD